jgi:putative tryptophan/tyrosine transport system substrate-binding protein
MQRREFIKLVGGVAASWPLAAQAQQQTMPVIGMVGFTVQSVARGRFLEIVRKELAGYGYIEGQNYRFEIKENNYQFERNPSLYRQFVDQKVSLIITTSTVGVQNARAATQSIPILFSIASDPVENGFVASLNKPGGNITGMFNLGVMLLGKRLEMLHELVPSVGKFAFLTQPNNQTLGELQMQHSEAAANSLGLSLLHVSAPTPDELGVAFETAVREGSGGMIIGADAVFNRVDASTQLVALAARYRLPTIYVEDAPVKAGGLISYAADSDLQIQALGRYAGRILKGEKPAELPVQLTTKTKLVINLKTAKALGITVPTTLLARADELIE